MKCIIVDDNKMARTALKKLVAEVDFLSLQGEFDSSMEAFDYLRSNSVDLLFLDVEMPGMSGIELLANLERRPIVILVTANRDYAVEAYELDVADYIVKPVNLSRFVKGVYKARDLFDTRESKEEIQNHGFIFIRSNSILTKVDPRRIIYVEEHLGKVNVTTSDYTHCVNTTLNNFIAFLPQDKFYRLHSDYLVAIEHIEDVNSGCVKIGNQSLPIAEEYRKGLMQRLKR